MSRYSEKNSGTKELKTGFDKKVFLRAIAPSIQRVSKAKKPSKSANIIIMGFLFLVMIGGVVWISMLP